MHFLSIHINKQENKETNKQTKTDKHIDRQIDIQSFCLRTLENRLNKQKEGLTYKNKTFTDKYTDG
jgi:hypothetical protein